MHRLAVLLMLVALPLPARALFHFIDVVEVYSDGGVQYVELQAYSSNQNLTNAHSVIFYNAVGAEITRVTATNVANGANQMSILFATAAAQDFFNVPADFLMTVAAIDPAGGKICWDALDCVAWGAYTGSAVGVGTPFAALEPGVAIHRRLDIAGSPTTLDAFDDTNNSANDFFAGTPSPRNNAGQLGVDDGDGVGFTDDNCPFFANPGQADADLDRRGDECECTDQNGDGSNTVADIVAINAAIFNPSLATPLCDGNNDGLCNVADIIASNVEIFSPTNTSTCARQPVPGP